MIIFSIKNKLMKKLKLSNYLKMKLMILSIIQKIKFMIYNKKINN